LEPPFDVGGRPFRLTASAGVAHAADSEDAEELIRRADVAMYRAKEQGGDRIVMDDEAMRDEVTARLRHEAELRTAVEGDGLEVHLQGEWSLPDRRLLGAEALARWRRPDGDLVAAGSFIPLAEECGLIHALGTRVLSETCDVVAGWMAQDRHDGFSVRVNLSPLQLRQDELADQIAGVLETSGLPAEHLCLELTESALLDDPERALRVLGSLRDLGVGLAVDDFGTGYSSLLYLKRLPVTSLKIDRAFVSGLPDDAADRAIVAAVVRLADEMGFDVTAEGVETEEQATTLVELGCVRAQGYLLSRPEPADDMAVRLDR
jgi:EAL domain-containing protein (putative c-di-GMP-specific phosphodiesterase class I)